MAREDYEIEYFYVENYCGCSMVTLEEDVEEVMNNIFRDFESRTCENCKYYYDYKGICLNEKNQLFLPTYEGLDNTFGCNRFERINK